MAGLILLAVLAGWSLLVYHGVRLAVQKVTNQRKQKVLRIILVPVVFLLPVADEIVGQFQFRALCSAQAKMEADEQKATGKMLIPLGLKKTALSGYVLETEEHYWAYKDSETNEILISWKDFKSKGGWLSNFIGFPDGHPPYTFGGSCLAVGGFDYVYNNEKFTIDTRINKK